MTAMRAKVKLYSVERCDGGTEIMKFTCVCGDGAFGPNGESEDNTFARYTPSGKVELLVTNPNLCGKFTPGQKFYVDITEAPEPAKE